jgi:hypothetical protein
MMKRLLMLMVVLLASAMLASAQPKKDNRAPKIEQELRDLVQTWDQAYVKGDIATLGRLLADEFAFVGGPNKSDYLASLNPED